MENRDIRIAFFDIDGTLLPPKGCSFTWQPAARRTTCIT